MLEASSISAAKGQSYNYDAWFQPLKVEARPLAVQMALNYADNCLIGQHEFFRVASVSPDALRLWVAQELVVTGPFSQELLTLASGLPNVHMRAMLMEVIVGEHGKARHGLARRSHPWLLDSLRRSIQLAKAEVRPVGATDRFLDRLRAEGSDPLGALAAIGVGNERLILKEYTAVKVAFSACWPNADYLAFLDANIHEDMHHSELISDVASAIVRDDEDAARYYAAAVRSVESRITYYDDLLELART